MNAPTKTVELPPPGFPMLTRVISHPLFADSSGRGDPVTWTVSQPHPLVGNMTVVRMFVDRGGVEIYSVTADGKNGVRNLIPMSFVRLVEEVMPLEIFIDELAAAEADDGDDDDEGDLDPDEPSAPAPAPSDGQVAS